MKPRKERPMVDVDLEPAEFVQIAPKLYVPASWTAERIAAFLAGRAR